MLRTVRVFALMFMCAVILLIVTDHKRPETVTPTSTTIVDVTAGTTTAPVVAAIEEDG